jgi:hypothetical protein
MAKKKVALAVKKNKAKNNKVKNNKKPSAMASKPALKDVRAKPMTRAVTAAAAAGTDYAIWDITFWHYDAFYNYYYPIFDDQIDTTLDLYIMGQAAPPDFADNHILAKVVLLNGTPLIGEAPAPHFDPLFYPGWWVATVAKDTLSGSTSYIVKVRQYQDKAAASSEFSTLPRSSPPSGA